MACIAELANRSSGAPEEVLRLTRGLRSSGYRRHAPEGSCGAARKGSRMRYVILVCLMAVGLGLIVFGLLGTPGNPPASFDPHRPAAFLPIAEIRFRELQSALSELVRDLVDEFAAPYREQLRRDGPTPSLPR